MRTLLFLLQKEFRQILRNKSILPLIFVMPVVQLLILPLAADYEVKNIHLAVTDHAHSALSQQLLSKITGSGYFRLTSYSSSYKQSFHQIEKDKADLILEIPFDFENSLVREGKAKVLISVNAINGVKAGLGSAYLNYILLDFNQEIQPLVINAKSLSPEPKVEVLSSVWYNPLLNYNFSMVPGILAALVTMIGSFLTALNIVKEKEVGTIEQINVSPIKKHHFILGKLIPFWVIGMIVFSVGLWVVAYPVYGIFPVGSILLLYFFLAIYLVAVLGMGLLISTYSETQQQSMSISFFFVMIFMLMSGLFTPVDSMPEWARIVAHLSPLTYFMEVMRMIVLKGSNFMELINYFYVIVFFAVIMNTWAIFNYRKTN